MHDVNTSKQTTTYACYTYLYLYECILVCIFVIHEVIILSIWSTRTLKWQLNTHFRPTSNLAAQYSYSSNGYLLWLFVLSVPLCTSIHKWQRAFLCLLRYVFVVKVCLYITITPTGMHLLWNGASRWIHFRLDSVK